MTEEIMTRIGEAVGTCSLGTFTIERDFRQHGAQLEEAFVSGLKKTGSNANLVGTCPVVGSDQSIKHITDTPLISRCEISKKT